MQHLYEIFHIYLKIIIKKERNEKVEGNAEIKNERLEEFETEGQINILVIQSKLSTRKASVKSAVSTNVRNINPSIKTSILRIVRMG